LVKAQIPNKELERIQPGVEGTRFAHRMVRGGHAVAASSKWQARPQAKLFVRSHSMLLELQSAIQFGATPDNWLGRIAHQVVRLAMEGA